MADAGPRADTWAGARGDRPIGAVIPAFNREATIERAVASALEQTHPPRQVVVVDDGSTDSTADVARSMGSRVEVISQPNSGVSVARNNGVAALRTPWVAFLDSDDHWDTGHLERMERAIEATAGEAATYFADATTTDLGPGVTWWEHCGFTIRGEHELRTDATGWVMRPLHPFLIQATVLNRARYLELGGMWDRLRTREDTHLFFLLGIGQPMCAVAGVGAMLTGDDSSGSRLTVAAGSDTSEYRTATIRMYDDVLDRFPDLRREHRRELRARIAGAHIGNAAAELRDHDPNTLRSLSKAVLTSPKATTQRGISAVRRVARQRTGPNDPEPL